VQENLPEYYWPAVFVMLDELPRLPNGKIDRQALPEPEPERNGEEFVPACSPAEKILARIWMEVLKLDRVSVHDNFFDLGGDSFVSAQIIAKAHKAGLKISPKQIVERPTVGGLSQLFQTAEAPGQ
jgi:aryl carrier-like protein